LATAIRIEEMSHEFNLGKTSVTALRHINLGIAEGEFVALVGKSGSGKSTLLNIIAGLMHPTAGTVDVKGERISEYDENQLCVYRQRHIGFIFQSFNLLGNYTALENIQMPLIFSGLGK
jgi:putative ABC transport system ATP-binding protein